MDRAAACMWTPRTAPEHRIRQGGGTAEPLPADATDEQLVQACLAGSAGAFDALVRRHQRQVYNVCRRFASQHEDAADLAQDVFLRAFRGLNGFKGRAAFSTWLYRITLNVCLNRVAVKAPPLDPLDAAAREDLSEEKPDAALLRAERAATVRAAIAKLPTKQRATLVLRIYHDLPHSQIAEILGSSVGAAKANLFHALANLKKLLQERS